MKTKAEHGILHKEESPQAAVGLVANLHNVVPISRHLEVANSLSTTVVISLYRRHRHSG